LFHLCLLPRLSGQPAKIQVLSDRPGHEISPYLTGACIEDVNHEIYGGLYSQMIFGESFQEPAPAVAPVGFQAFGGNWIVSDGELHAAGGQGPKIVYDHSPFREGSAGVELYFDDRAGGNAGLILRTSDPDVGADQFIGYEVSLSPADQTVRLGRHRNNWEHIRDEACPVPVGAWISLQVEMRDEEITVSVNGRIVLQHREDPNTLPPGHMGLRTWLRSARFRNAWIQTGRDRQALIFQAAEEHAQEISGMWGMIQRGSAEGSCRIVKSDPFLGSQSQRVSFLNGEGAVGIENQGLNRWGLGLEAGRPYEGVLWLRAPEPTDARVALESRDGSHRYADQLIRVGGEGESAAALKKGEDPEQGAWTRYEFILTPDTTDSSARFAIQLEAPGTVECGYAFLQPGEWGRFSGLPVRKDVAEALIDQGLTALRYGGSMINDTDYRWKKMIGRRDLRPPYHGTWYPYSSNGWGIIEFIAFCRAAGFLAIPAFNMGESPQDMVDFIEYVNGPATSEWGAKRVADGFPEPFNLRHIQLGNEERVDDAYFERFKPLAEAIWAAAPQMTIVVGDFVYTQTISDPWDFTGAASGITSLAAHEKILRLAKRHRREVWFDVHVWTDGPLPDGSLAGTLSLADRLEEMADGALHKVVVFELNANNHSQRRALAIARAIQAMERDGRIPVVLSANCLQPDGQNDNGWNQGLLFLNPSQVWLQPPGWVTRMMANAYRPVHVPTSVQGDADLDVVARQDADGRQLVLQVLNSGADAVDAEIVLDAFSSGVKKVEMTILAGDLDARNTAEHPGRITPLRRELSLPDREQAIHVEVPAYSFVVLRF
jgi:hypothetical protein